MNLDIQLGWYLLQVLIMQNNLHLQTSEYVESTRRIRGTIVRIRNYHRQRLVAPPVVLDKYDEIIAEM